MVSKWLIKAENDYKTANDELATENPVTDTICFHLQQCVEKYLKAFLIYHEKEIKKTHNIDFLLKKCIEIDSDFLEFHKKEVTDLTLYSVELRYPEFNIEVNVVDLNNSLKPRKSNVIPQILMTYAIILIRFKSNPISHK